MAPEEKALRDLPVTGQMAADILFAVEQQAWSWQRLADDAALPEDAMPAMRYATRYRDLARHLREWALGDGPAYRGANPIAYRP